MTVLFQKEAKGVDSQLIVGQAENEAENEIRLLEIEHAVVERYIHLLVLPHVVVTDGRVPVETVNFVVWLAGEQRNLDRVHRVWENVLDSRLLCVDRRISS
jgi:hypothetical protein